MTETKTGWWKVSFDIYLNEGEEHNRVDVRFDDLSEITQEHIIKCISEGFTQGEIVEEYGTDEEEGDPCVDF